MIGFLLAALIPTSAVALQEEVPPAPDAKVIEETLRGLEEAFRSSEPKAKAGALERAAEVADPKVVEAIARALGDSEREVVLAALQSLRWQRHPSSLEALHRAYKTRRELKKDDELSAALLKAIGQHADPRSIQILCDEPFETPSYPAIQARILGLGRIRSIESIQALMDLLKSTHQNSIDRFMDDFRLSLAVLTGTDQGPTSALWLRWWNDHKKDFVVPAELPELPHTMEMRWYGYWNLEPPGRRGKRREDRGEDRPRPKGRRAE